MITTLAWIGGFTVACWVLLAGFLLRMAWLNAAWDQQERARHADVDQLARCGAGVVVAPHPGRAVARPAGR